MVLSYVVAFNASATELVILAGMPKCSSDHRSIFWENAYALYSPLLRRSVSDMEKITSVIMDR